MCKPCAAAYAVVWRAKHPDKVRAANQKWYATHAEAARQRSLDFYAANTEKVRLYWKERYPEIRNVVITRSAVWGSEHPTKVKEIRRRWKQAHPEMVRVSGIARRAAKQRGLGLSNDLIPRLYEAQLGLCACCGVFLGAIFHVDHITPLALGGSHEDGNMQLLTPLCNMQKGKQHPAVFMQKRGREQFYTHK